MVAPAERSARRAISAWELFGFPLLVAAAVSSVALVFLVILRPPESSRADFYTLWDSGRAFWRHRDLYFGVPLRPEAAYNLNAPAVTILLFAPLARLPLRLAFDLWTAVNLAALIFTAQRIARELAVDATMVVCLLLISQATFLGLQFGHPIGLLTFALTSAWSDARAGRSGAAGLWLGPAIYAKPFLGLLLVYGLWRRDWRLVGGAAVSSVTVAIAGLLLGGFQAYRSWLAVLGHVAWAAHSVNASILGVVTRALDPSPADFPIRPIVAAPHAVTTVWG